MKKMLIYIGASLLLFTSSYADIQQEVYKLLLEDNRRWEKTKEKPGFQEFTCLEDPKESLIIALETRESDPYLTKKSEGIRTDLLSLLEREKEPSSLERMKELRMELKKTGSPYSIWKLLYVFDKSDIIYEYTVPKLGPYDPSYEITRLIKQEQGYLRITYTTDLEISKHSSVVWFHRLQEISLS